MCLSLIHIYIMRQRQSLYTITADILTAIQPVLEKERPDLVLVHGDTCLLYTSRCV